DARGAGEKRPARGRRHTDVQGDEARAFGADAGGRGPMDARRGWSGGPRRRGGSGLLRAPPQAPACRRLARRIACLLPARFLRSYPASVDADVVEIRVLGCLIEKQRTTPDVYP